MLEQSKQVILACWDAANRRDPSGFDRYYAENVVFHTTDGEIRGRDGVKAYLMGMVTAFPDVKLTVEDVFGEDDRVFSRARLEGTHMAELNGIPPTGKRVDIRWVMNAARVQDGKIVEEWEFLDRLDVMQQLGLLEAPALAKA